MKRICFVDFDMSVMGGVEQVTVSLANELCKHHEVFIYEINHGGNLAYELDTKIHFIQGVPGLTRLREMITGTFKPFLRFVKDNKIDVVFLMGNYPALIASFTRFLTKAKYVYCDHGGLMNQWKQKDITAIRFWNSRVSHKTVVLTEKTRNDYIDKFHLNSGKVQCIYNWIEEKVLNAKRDYNENSREIITVGRFGKEKGYDMLVEMAKNILPKYPDWQWHLYGTGEKFDEVAQKIEEYDLKEQLILKGNVKNVYQKYSDYAFLVLSSYREGLPLVLLEALAVGLPMVSFDIETGPNEIIEDNKNGFLIPPYQMDEMEKRIGELILDVEKRKAFSAYEGKKTQFSKAVILQQWLDVIEE